MFNNLKYAFRSLRILIKEFPLYILLEIVNALVLVCGTIIPVLVTELVVTSVTNNTPIEEVITKIVIYMGILTIGALINIVCNYAYEYINVNFNVHFSTKLFKKLDSIDYSFHESNEFLDNYTRALETGADKIYQTATGQIDLIKKIIQSASLFVVIYQVHYSAVLYSIIVGIIYMLVYFRIGKIRYKFMTKQRPYMRRRWYTSRIYFVKDSIADLKTTGMNDIMLDEHAKNGEKLVDVHDEFARPITFISVIGNFLTASIFPVVLGIMAYFALKNLDVSKLASFTVAASTLSNLIVNIAKKVTTIQENAVECKVPFSVLDMTSTIEGVSGKKVCEDFTELKVNDMSFKYPNGKDNTLNNISLHIRRGEKIAIVGENGAGKSTLVKLLLRLYDTSSGTIEIDGDRYQDLEASSIRNVIGAVFQNNEVYSVSVAENVLLRKMETKEDEKLVIEALEFADIYQDILKLPEGINTIVTREFHRRGSVFSKGQTQKIAVARGYAQNYQLLILDEPSSALDPLAEAKMYHNMLEMGRNKSLIFISHRLSATANVDRIYLFSYCRVAESGTHEELMKLNGIYKEMFASQAEKYIGGKHD